MKKILVVDDEVEACNALEEFLKVKGYDVWTAYNGQSALEKVKEVRPHIVLLDMIMPGMGGMEVLQEIKKLDPAIGVIMVTVVTDHDQRPLRWGPMTILPNPWTLITSKQWSW